PCWVASNRSAGIRSSSEASRTWSRPPRYDVLATKPPACEASRRTASTAGSSTGTSRLASPVRMSIRGAAESAAAVLALSAVWKPRGAPAASVRMSASGDALGGAAPIPAERSAGPASQAAVRAARTALRMNVKRWAARMYCSRKGSPGDAPARPACTSRPVCCRSLPPQGLDRVHPGGTARRQYAEGQTDPDTHQHRHDGAPDRHRGLEGQDPLEQLSGRESHGN